MAVTISFKDNADEVLNQLNTKAEKALFEMGAACQTYTKENTPVRTGALKGSWTVEVHGDEKFVAIGVPVGAVKGDYGKYVEFGTRKQKGVHMLRDAVQNHTQEYQSIAERNLKDG